MIVKRISGTEAKDFLQSYHYLETMPVGCISYGKIEGGVLRGVAVFKEKEGVGELVRFCLDDDAKKNDASQFLAKCLTIVDMVEVVTFADASVGHTGGIYKAVGGKYCGMSEDTVGFEINGKVYSGRNVDRSLKRIVVDGQLVKVRLLKGKHKFILTTKKGKELKKSKNK